MDILRLFYDCDEFCREFLPQLRARQVAEGRGRRERETTLSLSEVMTLLILFQTSGFRTLKTFYLRHVCRHLPTALEHARRQPGPVSGLADAFAAIEPQLRWETRATTAAQDETFLCNHANATITGSDGIEIRPDVRIGVSLIAPHTV